MASDDTRQGEGALTQREAKEAEADGTKPEDEEQQKVKMEVNLGVSDEAGSCRQTTQGVESGAEIVANATHYCGGKQHRHLAGTPAVIKSLTRPQIYFSNFCLRLKT